MGDGTKDDRPEKHRPQLRPPPQEESHLDDSSRTIYSMYSQLSDEEDNKMAERWQKNADGILIFAGLFSAAVAALLAASVQDLRPNSQDTSAFYLANIYQILANTNLNLSQSPIHSPVSGPPPFSPPRYAVWVNSLWFLSLVISLTCAALAMSLQQWARRYLKVTQLPRCSPEKRAQTRAFFAGGLDKMHVSWAVESLPALLHFSLFLFLSGLVIFLRSINHSVYLSIFLCVGLFITVYGWITFMPVLWPESPYYTPFSKIAVWVICLLIYMFCVVYSALLYAGRLIFFFPLVFLDLVLGCLRRLRIPRTDRHIDRTLPLLTQVLEGRGFYTAVGVVWRALTWITRRLEINTAIQTANISRINLGILDWSVVALGEDETLEKFFGSIPGFLRSQKVKDLRRHLPDRSNFIKSFGGFLGRTLSSNLISEEVKTRRLKICMNAANKICDSSDIYSILYHISHFSFDHVPQSIQTVQRLARWCTVSKGQRQIVACMLPQVRQRDDIWITLAKDQFGLEESVLRDNIAHDDNSVLLAIVLHVIRNRATLWGRGGLLSSLSRFDILNTDSGLQNEFCALWNELVQKAWDTNSNPRPRDVLIEIRQLYIALHRGTDAAPTRFNASTTDFDNILYVPSSYPMCTLASHHPKSADSSLTCNDHCVSSHPLFESQSISSSSTASQQAEGPTIILGLPSTSHSARPLTLLSPSLSPTANPVHIAPQVTSHMVPFVHEPIQIVTLNSNPRHSEGDSHLSRRPPLPTTDIGCPDKPTPDAPTNET